jgi:hypothetical protein
MTEVKQITLKGIKPITINDNNDNNKKENKKRIDSLNWTFPLEYYEYSNQMKIINNIYNNNYKHIDDISKITYQQIHKKINGYKQQDVIKKLLDKNKFLNFESVIDKMIECKLKCYYCTNEMNVLYDISREMKQWSVDRIDNNLGHNVDNFYLACLDCNLKRRRRNDDKFLFTKQLKIIKSDIIENN